MDNIMTENKNGRDLYGESGNRCKVYVDVFAWYSKEGEMFPCVFSWEDGKRYRIDRIIKKERCASRKAGGVGIMYTCMVRGQEVHLFFEVDRWFMERNG